MNQEILILIGVFSTDREIEEELWKKQYQLSRQHKNRTSETQKAGQSQQQS